MKKGTSWEAAEESYNRCVGENGHYYHQAVILPSTLRLLDLTPKSTGALLDLGCGQGVLARQIPQTVHYWGVDASPSLIRDAQKLTKGAHREFVVGDATAQLPVKKTDFDWAVMILCLQNMEEGAKAVANAVRSLKKGGKLLIVLNHPCFRIPRQSSWGFDEATQIQYRKMNGYMSPQKIPIQMEPGKGEKSSTTYSFHHPLSTYITWFSQAGLAVEGMEEWCSDKKSEGSKARMENRARKEFPLFLALLGFKL